MMLRFWGFKKHAERKELLLRSFISRHAKLTWHLVETQNLTLKESKAFVDRVLLVICRARGPVTEGDFVPHFEIAEMDMVHVTLHLASFRFNIVKREVRWSLR